MEKAFLDFLGQYVTEKRKQKMEKILSLRTRYLTVVMENLHKPHNGSAVLRTAECFGVQDVYVIEKLDKYKANPYVTRGSSKWIDIIKHSGEIGEGSKACYSDLKSKGYKIFATTPGPGSVPLDAVSVDHKIALVFGNEFEGLSDYALEQADEKITLPMYGFTKSYNISVTAAICLYNLVNKIRESGVEWELTNEEKEALRLKWYKKAVKHADKLEKSFFKEKR